MRKLINYIRVLLTPQLPAEVLWHTVRREKQSVNGEITIEHIKEAAEHIFRNNTCTKCDNISVEVYNCERCDELICNDCQATYNQFSQIDYNCCKDCANEN